MPRARANPRPSGEPQPDLFVATRLFVDELAEVDRRAVSAGLSRAAYLRAVLLADGDATAALRAALAERDAWVSRVEEEGREREKALAARIASLEAQLERAQVRLVREVEGWQPSLEVERRRQVHSLFYG
jgi:hypothetical protein